jgi:hypothetical protein
MRGGLLISYGTDVLERFGRAGAHINVERPVEQLTRLDPIINLETATALHLTIPALAGGLDDDGVRGGATCHLPFHADR